MLEPLTADAFYSQAEQGLTPKSWLALTPALTSNAAGASGGL
jgi:hypothetical protein